MEEKNLESVKVDSKFVIGLFITVLPFWGYVISFAFEYGYCMYFNIPIVYISVKLETILIFTVGVVLLLLVFYQEFDKRYGIIKRFMSKNKLNKFIVIRIFTFGFLFIYALLSKVSTNVWIIYSLIFFTSSILPLLTPLIRNKNKSYLQQFEKEYDYEINKDSITNNLFKKYNINLVRWSFLLLFSVIISMMVGSMYAGIKKEFYFLNNNFQKPIIALYNNDIITCSIEEFRTKSISHLDIFDKSKLDSFRITRYFPYTYESIDSNKIKMKKNVNKNNNQSDSTNPK